MWVGRECVTVGGGLAMVDVRNGRFCADRKSLAVSLVMDYRCGMIAQLTRERHMGSFVKNMCRLVSDCVWSNRLKHLKTLIMYVQSYTRRSEGECYWLSKSCNTSFDVHNRLGIHTQLLKASWTTLFKYVTTVVTNGEVPSHEMPRYNDW